MKSSLNRHYRNRKSLSKSLSIRPSRSFETLETRLALANTPPVILGTTPFVAVEDTPIEGQVSAMDPDGDPFVFSLKQAPAYGEIVFTDVAAGKFIYTPDPDFFGTTDYFIYVVTDIHGDVSNDGVVDLDVTAVDDVPIATNKTFWIGVGSSSLQGNLPVTDPDGDVLTYTVTNSPDKGVVSIGLNGSFIYVPDPGQTVGQDFFDFTATDPGGNVSNVGKVKFQYVIATNSITAVVDEFDPTVMTISGITGSVIISPNGSRYGLTIRGDGTYVNGSLQPLDFPDIKTLFIDLYDSLTPDGSLDGNNKVWVQSQVRLDYLEINTGTLADTIMLGANPNLAANNDVQDPNYGDGGYIHLKTYVVDTGDGGDTLYERYTRISEERTVNLGKGQDTFDLYGSVSTPESHTFIETKTLEDTVKLGYGSFFGSITVETGDLSDLISVYACYFGGTALFDAGQGDDTVAFDVNNWTANSTIDGGADGNFMLFSRSVAINALITLTSDHGFDNGDDEYVIGKYIIGSDGNGFLYANGGSRITALNLNSGFGSDKVTLSSNVIDHFYGELSEGDDELFLDGGIYNFIPEVHGGNGTNRLRNPNGFAVISTNFQLS